MKHLKVTLPSDPSAITLAALHALDGMLEVVHNEMLARGTYLSESVVNHDLARQGAVCGGHQACAVGALWLGAGVEIRQDEYGDGYYLPGAWPSQRTAFLASRPALTLAYVALNHVCDEYARSDERSDEFHRAMRASRLNYDAPMEALFEAVRFEAGSVVPLIDAHALFPVLIQQAAELILTSAAECATLEQSTRKEIP